MDEYAAKQAVVEAGRELVARGLVNRTWGNVSCRIDESRFAVTPTGVGYERLTPEMIVTVDKNTLQPEGTLRPSGETAIHAAAYTLRPEAGFVIHTHQCAATVLSVTGYHTLRLTGDEAALLGCTNVRRAAYGPPCSRQLCKNVAAALKETGAGAVLLARHGALAWGADQREAFTRAEMLEQICLRALKTEPPTERLSFRPEAMITAVRAAYPALTHLRFVDDDPILRVSETGRPLLPLLDESAQLLGVDVRCIPPEDPTRAPMALHGRSAVLITGRGALCAAHTEEDAAAVHDLLIKECLSQINARLYGGAAPLPLWDRLRMRDTYVNRYSKLK